MKLTLVLTVSLLAVCLHGAINLCRYRGLNPGAPAQKFDTLPLDRQATSRLSVLATELSEIFHMGLKPRTEADFDDYLDSLLDGIRTYASEMGLDPLPLPDYTESLSI
ncbi:unnamed protein product, partial [Timema podura]|nr:unnamed protein product [Timema podura]